LLAIGGIGCALSFHDAVHRHPRDHVLSVSEGVLLKILHPFPGSIQQYAEEITDLIAIGPTSCRKTTITKPITTG
jgi:hypothetical protein